ncbi:MAG: DNA polymerase III subunit gamma/tau [Bacteroidetes bacterium]|nr:DNA polymerase III subunit gamma/tau [Bacteroidota bacterium]
MDQFIVSARKYRPQTFESVVGQSHITTTLKNAILQNQLAHAFLFCGPRGVGKTTCARILAKTINCENLQSNGEACDQCISCVTFNEGGSLNIHELDAASNNSVDDIRALIEQVRFVPQRGKFKVYIIDEVHMLSQSAFNAFLKTLEEPPHYAIFILATTEKHKILPTILSRCQIFDFKRITIQDTAAHLSSIAEKESINAEPAALELIAQKSEGCMRDSLSILDKIVSFTGGQLTYANTLEHLNILDADYFFRLLAFMQQEDTSGMMLLYDEINRKGFEPDVFLHGLLEFFRNLLVCKDDKMADLLEAVESFKQKYRQTASATSFSFILSALNILNEAEIQLRQARNKRLHIELTLLKLAFLEQAIELTADGKKKRVEQVRSVQFRALTPRRETGVSAPPPSTKVSPPESKMQEPKVLVEKEKSTPANPYAASTAIGTGKLAKIREKVSQQLQTAVVQKNIDADNLREAVGKYILKLKESQKNSAATNFEMMSFDVVSQEEIEVVCTGDIQLGFFKQERNELMDYLRQTYQHPLLRLESRFVEIEQEAVPAGVILSTRDQYLKLTEQYPLIKSLKERLGLELDY